MRAIGIGLIGFGWMGQAHSRSCLRLPTIFRDRAYDPRLVICADPVADRRELATRDFGFADVTDDWRKVVGHADVDAVWVTAPNMLHEETVVAAADAGLHVFCEKPVGGTPEQTARIAAAAERAEIISGVGYNYRWAPLVQYAKHLVDTGVLGEITNYRGRFFSMYGADPMGQLSWRYLVDQGGHGVTTDILSHAVDLAHFLIGPIEQVVGTLETFIPERPLPRPGAGSHYDRGTGDDPTGAVTNEDYAAMLAMFADGARGTFEVSRSLIGPESQNTFHVYGTRGALRWNLETMNELSLYLAEDVAHTGYRTVYGGDRFPYHGAFVPGHANGIGFEDLIAIEDHEFLSSIAADRAHRPGVREALAFVEVQDALLRSHTSGTWEHVAPLDVA